MTRRSKHTHLVGLKAEDDGGEQEKLKEQDNVVVMEEMNWGGSWKWVEIVSNIFSVKGMIR